MPTYRYTIKKGHEGAVFSEQGIRRVSPTEIEADHELYNPILSPVEAKKPTDQPSADDPVTPAAPAQPPAPASAPVTPAVEAPATNKESEK